MTCPKCKSEHTEALPLNTVLPGEQGGATRAAGSAMMHRTGLSGVLALATMAGMAAKAVFSVPYRCKSCGNHWRKW